ncbi:unnamed protein product [Cladocopium goreaui]|uniref:Uncharacterized protein n=1 Tax=Cladocopium goreaui TaxID=2562237 RepID=A0A9P1FKT4_9DINO|nr:unnamed protein product [Cladocopium goreaui]
MGAASSDLDRAGQAQVLWTLPHHSGNNVWTNYVMSRYGMGYSVTGVSASLALPRLLRRRMQDGPAARYDFETEICQPQTKQDWIVDNLAFYFVSNGLSFGMAPGFLPGSDCSWVSWLFGDSLKGMMQLVWGSAQGRSLQSVSRAGSSMFYGARASQKC